MLRRVSVVGQVPMPGTHKSSEPTAVGGVCSAVAVHVAGGVHVRAYLRGQTWIEADPDVHKVIEIVLPTDNQWFKAPVVFVRWRWLGAPESPNKAVQRTGSSRFAQSTIRTPSADGSRR